jgi:hypothetical protein
MFTEQRVIAELGRFGWQECGRDDVIMEHSDQWFPPDHPVPWSREDRSTTTSGR